MKKAQKHITKKIRQKRREKLITKRKMIDANIVRAMNIRNLYIKIFASSVLLFLAITGFIATL